MRHTEVPRRLLLLLPLLVACASGDSGSAACAWPDAHVTPTSARPGGVVLVRAVLPGPCDDTGQEDHLPIQRRDVAITLAQQGVVVELAVVPDDDLGIEARVVVPQSAPAGLAEVVVGNAVAADLLVLDPR